MIGRVLYPSAERMYAGRFTAFTDVLYLALMVLVGSLALVTLFVSVAAGADLLRARAARDVTVTWGAYCRRWWQGVRRPGLLLLPSAVIALVSVDLMLAPHLPGGEAGTWPVVAVAVLVVALTLRAAGTWRPGAGVREVCARSVSAVQRDPIGLLLIVAALGCLTAIVAWVHVLAFAVPGLLALAAAGVDARAGAEPTARGDAITAEPAPAPSPVPPLPMLSTNGDWTTR